MKQFPVKNTHASIRYHDLPGKGDAILFIHGLGCASSLDYPQVAVHDLCGHRRILVDLLGSSFSDKPMDFDYSIESHAAYLHELTAHLKLDRFHVYGHSMGGSIAVTLASKCAKQICSLVLSEANLDSGGGFFSSRIASFSEEEYCAHGHGEMIRLARKETNENWAASLETSLPAAIHREATSLVKGTTPSWRNKLYSLKVPRTFIFGDKSLPDLDVSELEKHSVNIQIVSNAGHSMAWDNPKGLAAAIMQGICFAGESE